MIRQYTKIGMLGQDADGYERLYLLFAMILSLSLSKEVQVQVQSIFY